MDNDEIKKALDHFENDEFSLAKDILTKEIKKKVNNHFKDKLELKNDLEPDGGDAAAKEPDEGIEDPEKDAEPDED